MNNRRKNPIGVEALRRQIARLEQSRPRSGNPPISSGCGPLDRLLPEGGFRRGTLAEWLSVGEGGGATGLALAAGREACRPIGGGLEQSRCEWAGGVLVVLDRLGEFYPPAAARLGIEPENLIVIQAGTQADNCWALDQALRCPGVAAVLAWLEKLDGRTFRRLQLAAEEGGGLGLLIRPPPARQEPSWADVRLLVEPLPATSGVSHQRRLRIHLLRCRGGANGRSVDLVIDDETRSVHLAAQLADPAASRHAAGA
jgi:protein ImuA